MNVAVVEARTPLPDDFKSAMKAVQGKAVDWRTNPDEPFTTSAAAAGIVASTGGITGSGPDLVLDPAQNNSFRLINRAIAAGASARVAPPANGNGVRYIVTGLDPAKADAWATELAVRAERATAAGAISAQTRVAVFKSSPGVMDEGWTEWLFDSFGGKYTLITPADIRAGNLGAKFDVIVTASQGIGGGGGRGGRGGGAGAGGGRGGRGGAAADSAAQEEIRAIDEFVRGGGTVVAWNQGATSLVNALRLPVRNVVVV